MTTKIATIVVFAGKQDDPLVKVWADLYKKNFALAKNSDTEVDVFYQNKGLEIFDEFNYRHLIFLNEREMFHAALEIEKMGYDAVFPTCFYEPVIEELRKVLDIPVIAQAETEFVFAMMMGRKFGVVAISDEGRLIADDIIHRYGLTDRAVKSRSFGVSGEHQANAVFDASHDIEGFKEAAKGLIADGADVLVPGCSYMSMALRFASGCEDKYPDGLREVDGAPVVDGMSVLIKAAEAMVALKRDGSNIVSNRGAYKKWSKEANEVTFARFPYQGYGVWKA